MTKTQTTQLDLFADDHIEHKLEMVNPFKGLQGVNLFGQRALFTGFCACTGGDLVRAAYGGTAA
jgi:hypothetical protein